jgi:hypothetical protein
MTTQERGDAKQSFEPYLKKTIKSKLSRNQQCCGSGMFIPNPGSEFFYPGSRIRIFSIPDPESASKNLNILTPNNGL